MFELNLASLPNHILYLPGVQLSYIKVFVHIYNLWQSKNPCYIGNDEFMRRTNLARSTIQEALAFFEKNEVFTKVQKGRKRYLVETRKYIEIEQGPEIADTRARDSRPKGPEIADHNIKTNIKNNKSFCSSNDKKIGKEKISSGFSSVECQSNSYNPDSMNKIVPISPLMAEVINKQGKK